MRLRKHIFDQLKVCLEHSDRTINDLFKMFDSDSNHGINIDELYSAFMEMQLTVSRPQVE